MGGLFCQSLVCAVKAGVAQCLTDGGDTGNTGNTGNTGDTGDTGDTGKQWSIQVILETLAIR